MILQRGCCSYRTGVHTRTYSNVYLPNTRQQWLFTPNTTDLTTVIQAISTNRVRSGLSTLSGHNFTTPTLANTRTHCICSHGNDGVMDHMQSKTIAPWPAHCCNTYITILYSRLFRALCPDGEYICVLHCKLPWNFPLKRCPSQKLEILKTLYHTFASETCHRFITATPPYEIYIGVYFPSNISDDRTTNCAHFCAAQFQVNIWSFWGCVYRASHVTAATT